MAGLIKHRRWWRPPMVVRLNRTKFAQARRASWRETDELHHPTEAWIGARAWRYSEKHYFGNPGHYQDYVLTSSSAASFSGVDFEALGPISQATTDDSWSDDAEDLLRRFRRDTRITTVTVMSPHLIADSYPWTYGPHGDEVRLLG